MAKKAYIGVDGKARKVKKIYVGVDGKARKVKKGYIGVGGVARPFFTGGEVAYWGTATALRNAVSGVAAVSNGTYAYFGGGVPDANRYYKNAVAIVTAYNNSLTRSSPSNLTQPIYKPAVSAVGSYAVFAGGTESGYANSVSGGLPANSVSAYNTSNTKSSPPSLSTAVMDLAGASVGDYALFAGGEYDDGEESTYVKTVNAYNTSMTKSNPTSLSFGTHNLAGGSIGNYALFCGGYNYDEGGLVSTVNAYNTSLTRTIPTALSKTTDNHKSANTANHVLFAGGRNTTSDGDYGTPFSKVVNAYNASLTLTTPTVLSVGMYLHSATSLEGKAMFAGGYPDNYENGSTYHSDTQAVVNIYDESLTRTIGQPLSLDRCGLAATSIGSYALFGGGVSWNPTWDKTYKEWSVDSTYSDVVDVYTVG